MPITKGQGNPDWTRDETVLALSLLYKHGKPVDRHHPDVHALSRLLREATIHPPADRNERFRNPDGVALKLQNLFSAVDPNRGLSSSKTDRALVEDYPPEKAADLERLASTIRDLIGRAEQFQPSSEDDESAFFVEGEWLTTRHRRRERKLRTKVLARRTEQQLRCEICAFSAPRHLDRFVQESYFEAHHTIPLAEAEGTRLTRVSDMALLCACCHRVIHKLMSSKRRWIGIEEARTLLVSASET
ncbi:HNH endonuclease [Rhizobium straminoryzae]|uniref:HNH endonuclease n=1 Tax=Rhizobium straminoryzae TaxID=1387186 RepID=A0A549T0X5_9HYPH|nr:HNH endonuclease [Rhizobium straminoryzae]TRL35521.1 HNH endonuclease [Rhizobium straminoryzae]